ncbi:hypothetical protein [Lentilactobacillus hilgardii]|uniref:hypothetical protein n=1 Tax=Lentilactobacillus hilgardii TaxID=1588 RepID=UPI0021A860C0|nr:hypothetical protein [Lentilactobacillus hilgardii]MCT3390359.1 hypothetical protein [Lentilactobacillus hilgardii]
MADTHDCFYPMISLEADAWLTGIRERRQQEKRREIWMKFSDLKHEITALNLKTRRCSVYSVGKSKLGKTLILEGGSIIYAISENTIGLVLNINSVDDIPLQDRLILQKLAYKYSRTPLNERRDDPKFYVKMMPGGDDAYLNQSIRYNELFMSDRANTTLNKTIFNEFEYDKIQHKYPQWFPKFDKNDPHFEFMEGDGEDEADK